MRGLRVAVACTVGLIPVSAVGFVVVTNGNYFLTFTDIELSDAAGNTTMGVTRTYNSRTQFRGMLGYGWGNDFDTYLIPSEDGSIVIQEIGAGDKTRFQRPSFNAMEL